MKKILECLLAVVMFPLTFILYSLMTVLPIVVGFYVLAWIFNW